MKSFLALLGGVIAFTLFSPAAHAEMGLVEEMTENRLIVSTAFNKLQVGERVVFSVVPHRPFGTGQGIVTDVSPDRQLAAIYTAPLNSKELRSATAWQKFTEDGFVAIETRPYFRLYEDEVLFIQSKYQFMDRVPEFLLPVAKVQQEQRHREIVLTAVASPPAPKATATR